MVMAYVHTETTIMQNSMQERASNLYAQAKKVGDFMLSTWRYGFLFLLVLGSLPFLFPIVLVLLLVAAPLMISVICGATAYYALFRPASLSGILTWDRSLKFLRGPGSRSTELLMEELDLREDEDRPRGASLDTPDVGNLGTDQNTIVSDSDDSFITTEADQAESDGHSLSEPCSPLKVLTAEIEEIGVTPAGSHSTAEREGETSTPILSPEGFLHFEEHNQEKTVLSSAAECESKEGIVEESSPGIIADSGYGLQSEGLPEIVPAHAELFHDVPFSNLIREVTTSERADLPGPFEDNERGGEEDKDRPSAQGGEESMPVSSKELAMEDSSVQEGSKTRSIMEPHLEQQERAGEAQKQPASEEGQEEAKEDEVVPLTDNEDGQDEEIPTSGPSAGAGLNKDADEELSHQKFAAEVPSADPLAAEGQQKHLDDHEEIQEQDIDKALNFQTNEGVQDKEYPSATLSSAEKELPEDTFAASPLEETLPVEERPHHEVAAEEIANENDIRDQSDFEGAQTRMERTLDMLSKEEVQDGGMDMAPNIETNGVQDDNVPSATLTSAEKKLPENISAVKELPDHEAAAEEKANEGEIFEQSDSEGAQNKMEPAPDMLSKEDIEEEEMKKVLNIETLESLKILNSPEKKLPEDTSAVEELPDHEAAAEEKANEGEISEQSDSEGAQNKMEPASDMLSKEDIEKGEIEKPLNIETNERVQDEDDSSATLISAGKKLPEDTSAVEELPDHEGAAGEKANEGEMVKQSNSEGVQNKMELAPDMVFREEVQELNIEKNERGQEEENVAPSTTLSSDSIEKEHPEDIEEHPAASLSEKSLPIEERPDHEAAAEEKTNEGEIVDQTDSEGAQNRIEPAPDMLIREEVQGDMDKALNMEINERGQEQEDPSPFANTSSDYAEKDLPEDRSADSPFEETLPIEERPDHEAAAEEKVNEREIVDQFDSEGVQNRMAQALDQIFEKEEVKENNMNKAFNIETYEREEDDEDPNASTVLSSDLTKELSEDTSAPSPLEESLRVEERPDHEAAAEEKVKEGDIVEQPKSEGPQNMMEPAPNVLSSRKAVQEGEVDRAQKLHTDERAEENEDQSSPASFSSDSADKELPGGTYAGSALRDPLLVEKPRGYEAAEEKANEGYLANASDLAGNRTEPALDELSSRELPGEEPHVQIIDHSNSQSVRRPAVEDSYVDVQDHANKERYHDFDFSFSEELEDQRLPVQESKTGEISPDDSISASEHRNATEGSEAVIAKAGDEDLDLDGPEIEKRDVAYDLEHEVPSRQDEELFKTTMAAEELWDTDNSVHDTPFLSGHKEPLNEIEPVDSLSAPDQSSIDSIEREGANEEKPESVKSMSETPLSSAEVVRAGETSNEASEAATDSIKEPEDLTTMSTSAKTDGREDIAWAASTVVDDQKTESSFEKVDSSEGSVLETNEGAAVFPTLRALNVAKRTEISPEIQGEVSGSFFKFVQTQRPLNFRKAGEEGEEMSLGVLPNPFLESSSKVPPHEKRRGNRSTHRHSAPDFLRTHTWDSALSPPQDRFRNFKKIKYRDWSESKGVDMVVNSAQPARSYSCSLADSGETYMGEFDSLLQYWRNRDKTTHSAGSSPGASAFVTTPVEVALQIREEINTIQKIIGQEVPPQDSEWKDVEALSQIVGMQLPYMGDVPDSFKARHGLDLLKVVVGIK